MAAGARKEQHAELFRLLVRSGKGRKLPRLTQGAARAPHQRQPMRPSRPKVGGVKMPVLAAGIAHAAGNRSAVNLERGRVAQRLGKRSLDKDSAVADGRQQVSYDTAVPCRAHGHRSGLRKQIRWRRQ